MRIGVVRVSVYQLVAILNLQESMDNEDGECDLTHYRGAEDCDINCINNR